MRTRTAGVIAALTPAARTLPGYPQRHVVAGLASGAVRG